MAEQAVPVALGRRAPRDLAGKAMASACYAPVTSMYFDQFGDVRACCQNSEVPLGNVTRATLREIWESASAERLRAALERDDLSQGCRFCAWQASEGNEVLFADQFDRHPVPVPRPAWPVQMELSLTNACNLQCAMCNGDLSSAIRAHRERRPPLPAVYGDAFFEQLADFLPHLQHANFLGGEPFLGREPLRVLDLMVELGLRTPVAVTTNGTQWSDRIERICDQLPVSFVLSLDAATKATYEQIRVGADFDVVMGNLDRFDAAARRHGTGVSLAFCLMTTNWHEFADVLALAEARAYPVGVNTVVHPTSLSLYQLPAVELAEVVAGLEAQGERRRGELVRLGHVWDEQLAALRNRLAQLQEGGAGSFVRPAKLRDHFTHHPPLDGDPAALLRAWAGGEPWTVTCDADDRVVALDPGLAALLGEQATGQTTRALLEAFGRRFGSGDLRTGPTGHLTDLLLVFRDGREARLVITRDDPGTRLLVAMREPVAP